MEFSLDATDLDNTCLMVSAWLMLALALCFWFLHSTSSKRVTPQETDPDASPPQ